MYLKFYQMKKTFTLSLCAFIFGICITLSGFAQTHDLSKAGGDSCYRVKVSTDSGDIIIRLYDETPLHRDNFVKLVRRGFYDSLLFHRIIPEFMIQGGDPQSKNAPEGSLLGSGGDELGLIPAELNQNLIHKKGVLAAARNNNPQKASSACQFYIVQGKKHTEDELFQIQQRTGILLSAHQKKIYKTIGGTPWLDGNYTVFGETESGFEVIDKIAALPRDANNRPLTDIRMKIEILE